MNLHEILAAGRARLLTPARVAFLVVIVAVAGLSVWALRPDPAPDASRIIAAGNRATGKAGKPRMTQFKIFETADNVCSTLRHKQSLIEAHSQATRLLGSTPKDSLNFVFVTIDNRCPEVDDEGLINNHDGKLNKDYR